MPDMIVVLSFYKTDFALQKNLPLVKTIQPYVRLEKFFTCLVFSITYPINVFREFFCM
jgi:hypothetical protein